MIRKILLILMGGVLMACTSEKSSLSPLYSSGSVKTKSGNTFISDIKDKNSELFYASELTNEAAMIPDFLNEKVNRAIQNLQYHANDYVYNLQEYRRSGQKVALQNVEKSYVKIQKLRKFLNSDEDEILNRFLVKIKSHITQLEAINANINRPTN